MSTKIIRSVQTAITLASVVALQEGAAQNTAGPPASAAAGREVYLRIGCDACHGTVGHGGAAPRLAPDPLPMAALSTWVRNGTPGWSIARGMPAYSTNVLSDKELEEIFSYLSSIPPPPDVDDIPLLEPIADVD